MYVYMCVYLKARMCIGWDLRRFCLGDTDCSVQASVVAAGRCDWPFCSKGVESVSRLHVVYRLSKEEFMSFTSASRSTSSSVGQGEQSNT